MGASPLVAASGWSAGAPIPEREAWGRRPDTLWNGRTHPERPAAPSPEAIVHLLVELGVPFATFDPTGRCTELSPAARALLGDDAERACRLGASLLEPLLANHATSSADLPDSVSTLRPGGGHLLRAQRLPAGDPRRTGIVLILPIRTARSPLDGASWGLSGREWEVAALIAGGASARDAAASLGISVHTVRRHTERVFAKLGVKSRMQLVVLIGAATERSAHPTPAR
jgi:DNA-binding CsgD family transcriptional regulator